MKKAIPFLLSAVLILLLASCGNSAEQSSTTPAASGTVSAAPTTASPAGDQSAPGSHNVQDVFYPAKSGSYATIKIDSSVQLDDDSAWLGLVPTGKDYITEEEADAADIIWFSLDMREEGDPYVFACDFEPVEDGRYTLVVASSDDAAIGYVVLQLEMTKDGDNLTFDYSGSKWNERPAA